MSVAYSNIYIYAAILYLDRQVVKVEH